MNRYWTARHSSNQLVVKEARSHAQTTNKIQCFADAINRLDAINGEVDELMRQQAKTISGATDEKNNSRTTLIDWMMVFSGGCYSHAVLRNDVRMMAKTDIAVSKIDRKGREGLLVEARNLLEIARNIPTEQLAVVGLSADDVAAFAASIVTFDELKSAPREAVLDRSVYTEHLSTLFAESNTLCQTVLDKLVIQFRRIDPDFYLKYKSARILSLGGSKGKNDELVPVTVNK